MGDLSQNVPQFLNLQCQVDSFDICPYPSNKLHTDMHILLYPRCVQILYLITIVKIPESKQLSIVYHHTGCARNQNH